MKAHGYRYKAKDLSCKYCLYHKKCSLLRPCPFIPEKVEAGISTPQEALEFLSYELNNKDFTLRLKKYFKSCRRRKQRIVIFNSEHHRDTFYSLIKTIYRENTDLLSAVFLLSADYRLWIQSWRYIEKNRIVFGKIHPKSLTAEGYSLFCAAKDIYLGTRHFNLKDLSDPRVIDRNTFGLICNAMAIRRYGYNYIRLKEGNLYD